jgi:catechol 2,3-dioxygenase-like lactoylglutathione lyase family enzyme
MPSTTITDVRTVGIGVRDQDAAVGFFVETLGFEKRLDAQISPEVRWIEVVPLGATTSVALNQTDRPAGITTDTGIRYVVPDVDAEHAAMRGRGVDVGEVMRWDGVPPMYSFDDPDGNRFYIVEEVR